MNKHQQPRRTLLLCLCNLWWCLLLLLIAASRHRHSLGRVQAASASLAAAAAPTTSSPPQDNDSSSSSSSSPFMIIIDGGSTASRLHVYEFIDDNERCIRRGTARTDVPLSAFAFADNVTDVAAHLQPALEHAATIIPPHYHATTPLYYQATAGMRLLSSPQQDDVYNSLYLQLQQQQQQQLPSFDVQRQNLATLDGDLEGFYGAVAANYLKGTINAQLEFIVADTSTDENTTQEDTSLSQSSQSSSSSSSVLLGALDMGGSSTQIVFLPDAASNKETPPVCRAGDDNAATMSTSCIDNNNNNNNNNDDDDDEKKQPSLRLMNGHEHHDFFATSYLSYGVDQFRERLWTALVRQHHAAVAKKQKQQSQECDAKWIENPCAFKGYEIEWDDYTLVGTGNAEACIHQVQRLIPHHPTATTATTATTSTNDSNNKLGRHVVGGVAHPQVRGKFVAMSLYFFTLDSLRELSHHPKHSTIEMKRAHDELNLSWPTPTLRELYNALDGLCSRSWQGDLAEMASFAHEFTRPHVLPHRCFESVYMVTLLKDGFGFDPHARDITFSFLVDGSEVEWSLGMALVLKQQQQQQQLAAAQPAPSVTNVESKDTTAPSRSNFTSAAAALEDDDDDDEEKIVADQEKSQNLFQHWTQLLFSQ